MDRQWKKLYNSWLVGYFLQSSWRQTAHCVRMFYVCVCVYRGCGGVVPSRCSSCSGPPRFVSPGTAGGRFFQHKDGHCNCGTAQWPPYRTDRPTWEGGNIRPVSVFGFERRTELDVIRIAKKKKKSFGCYGRTHCCLEMIHSYTETSKTPT